MTGPRFRITEIFPTVQGEGSRAGSPAVFVRFTGCNLWTGLDSMRDKGKGECAQWCDTFFAQGDTYTIDDLYAKVLSLISEWSKALIVISGGEPMLQLRKKGGDELLKKLKSIPNVDLAIETNGTVDDPVLDLFDHITVSPKALKDIAGHEHVLRRRGTDLKVITPGLWTDDDLKAFSSWDFKHTFFQPKDTGDAGASSVKKTIDLCQKYGWRVSFQTHKYAGLP